MAESGSPQALLIATTATGTYTALSGVGSGFTGLTGPGEEAGTFETVSGGLTQMGLAGSTVATASFTVDETPATAALLHGLNGARRFFRHQPQGAGTGNRQTQFEAILTITWAAEQRGRRTYAVELAIDGALTETTL